jgi:hypothetical protein
LKITVVNVEVSEACPSNLLRPVVDGSVGITIVAAAWDDDGYGFHLDFGELLGGEIIGHR